MSRFLKLWRAFSNEWSITPIRAPDQKFKLTNSQRFPELSDYNTEQEKGVLQVVRIHGFAMDFDWEGNEKKVASTTV